jgi:hypothetical protein
MGIIVRTRNFIIGGVALVIGLAAVGSATGGSKDSLGSTAATPPPAANAPAAPAATSAPAAEAAVKVGQPVKVDDNLTVTVLDAKYATSNGQFQKPAAGYVYMGVKVRYEASHEAFVSSGDWNVLADGTKQGQWAILIGDNWEPTLPFSQLAAGASVEGWMTFEVPKPAKFAEVRFDNKMFSDDAPQLVTKFTLN